MKADINSIMIYAMGLLITFFLLHFTEKVKVKNRINIFICLLIVALPLSILAGCRYGIGTDYFSYLLKFKYVQDYSWSYCFVQHETEILFALIIKIAYILGRSYEFVFFFMEFLTIVIGLVAINRLRDKINVSFAFFIFYLLTYHQSYNIIRQTLAMSIVLLALTYLIDRNYIKYVVIVVVATFIHTTAILCLVFLLVPLVLRRKTETDANNNVAKTNLRLKLVLFYAIVLATPIIAGQLLQIVIKLSGLSNYIKYVNSSVDIGVGTIVIAMMMIAPVYIYGRKYAYDNIDEYGILKDTLILFLPISFLGYYASWASRLNAYPQLTLIILLPMLFRKSSIRYTPLLKLYYIAYLVFIFINDFWINNYNQTFPYVFFK